jgi:hypothetical protein
MLISPPVLALNGIAVSTSLLMLMAAAFALKVLRHWDIDSGSELQVSLERRTYLISTLVSWCFVAGILSLLLFVHNAEQLSTQFVGAMCATGVLNVNPWGWPALFMKCLVFFAAAVWLLLNHIDQQSPDYPLVRAKYGLLLALTPLLGLEAMVQIQFFRELDPDVITSCCGALFTAGGAGVAATVSALDPALSLVVMYASGLALFGLGILYLWRRCCPIALTVMGTLAFFSALAAVISSVALYVYEHPQHHCPFCILKSGYGFIGYWMYLPLFSGAALLLGVGLITRWRRSPSLDSIIRVEGPRLASLALVLFGLFYAVATYAVLRSNLTMSGVWW